MFRVTLGLATATFFGLAAASPASAGCCGSPWGFGWGGGCCNTSYVYAQPAPVYVQPAPVYIQQAAPIVVQAPPQQVIVQQSQPEVIFQQQAVAPVPSYTVDQGPYYAGPQAIGYSQPQYYADQPVRPYPYVSGYVNPDRGYGRPYYRGYRAHRPWVGPRAYRYGHRYHHAVAKGAYVKRHWN